MDAGYGIVFIGLASILTLLIIKSTSYEIEELRREIRSLKKQLRKEKSSHEEACM